MVITVIALLALIIFIIVGVMARKNQEKKDKKHVIEHQILQLTKFKGELMSHHTLEDTFKNSQTVRNNAFSMESCNMSR